MKKKMSTLVLTALLSAGLLMGCGNEPDLIEPTETQQIAPTDTETQTATEAGTEAPATESAAEAGTEAPATEPATEAATEAAETEPAETVDWAGEFGIGDMTDIH